MKFSAAVLISATLLAIVANAGAGNAKSPAIVVELFTSQGCSSCPPAERLLSKVGRDPGVIALAYHVTYWDRLGWKDPFSFPAATTRQSDYARAFGEEDIYTPQVVINGKVEFVGSDKGKMSREIKSAEATAKLLPLDISRDSSAPGYIDVTVKTNGDASNGSTPVKIVAMLRQSGLETSILRGENSGLKMINDYVVRDFAESKPFQKPDYPLTVHLSLQIPVATQSSQLQVVALLQSVKDGAILGTGILAP